MMIETTQIVYGPGRFLPVGTQVEMSAWEATDLINAGKAKSIETAALGPGPENAMLTPPVMRPRPPKRS